VNDDIRAKVRAALLEVAPDADLDSLDDDVDLREELDIDSMDYLNFAIALSKELGVDVPEAEVGQLATVAGAVKYLSEKASASS
jgi:acyl carrier protein